MGDIKLESKDIDLEQDVKKLTRNLIQSYARFLSEKYHSNEINYVLREINSNRVEYIILFDEVLMYWLNISDDKLAIKDTVNYNSVFYNHKLLLFKEISAMWDSISEDFDKEYLKRENEKIYYFIKSIFNKTLKVSS
ncbi:hypothetical protein [Clostridioides sp. ZZV15-6597]|uniref:hypothetical protein n=1 Tax=Clostridioides sp. ZZV15-6597 TaxID=2811500 RepID=UPI001D0F6C87|nr:hypothetical protein [Clostridioides sp. ZZV15-6597]HBF1820575.1 hypothetical protein [Clostridioides difficile]